LKITEIPTFLQTCQLTTTLLVFTDYCYNFVVFICRNLILAESYIEKENKLLIFKNKTGR